MAETPLSEGKPQKATQRGKGKALNALAAASGRDPALIQKEVAKAAALKEEEERQKRLAEEEQSRKQATPAGIYNSLSPQEQYRYECFRRCTFPTKPIEEFVAKTMVEEAHRRCLVRKGILVGLGAQSSGSLDNNIGPDEQDKKSTATEVTDASTSSDDPPNQSKKRRKRTKKSLLKEESKRRREIMDQPLPYLPVNQMNSISDRGKISMKQNTPPLDDLVVPGSASEIVDVVSTLAKCYAQRLVAAARRVADAEEEAKASKTVDGENKDAAISSESTSIKPLQPHHYKEAFRHRVEAGIDPGFWMHGMIKKVKNRCVESKHVGVAESAAVGRKNWNSAHLAALAAQDAYDEMLKEESAEAEEEREEEQKMEIEEEAAK